MRGLLRQVTILGLRTQGVTVSVATAVVTVVGIVAVMIMGAVMTLGMGTEDPQGTHHLIVVVEIILLSCLMGEGQEGKDRILLMKGTMLVVADDRFKFGSTRFSITVPINECMCARA